MPDYKNIAIIGGGPAGISAAKALEKEPHAFHSIDLYERQAQLGGIWNYAPKNKTILKDSVSEEDAGELADINLDFHGQDPSGNNGYLSPLYEHLETNVPKEVMMFKDTPFPSNLGTFPSRVEIKKYIQKYADTIDKDKVTIKLNSKVENVIKNNDSNVWNITVYDYVTQKSYKKTYDVIIVCNGHFNAPYIPDVIGLKEWLSKDKLSVIHSKFYDNPNEYANKTVLVVGNSYSGVDITSQLLTVAKKVYVSANNINQETAYKNLHFNYIDTIDAYNVNERSIQTVTGETVENVDKIIFATGYIYDIPFINTYKDLLVDKKGKRINNLYKDIFFIYDPSLIFINLNNEVLPNPFSEAQAAYISRVLSGRLKLPSLSELEKLHDERLEKLVTEKNEKYHYLIFPKDIGYIKELQQVVNSINDGKGGASSIEWPENRYQLRNMCLKLKQQRLDKIIDHALKLRKEGKTFHLLRDDNEANNVSKP